MAVQERNKWSYFTIFSIARTIKNLFSERPQLEEEPELAFIDGLKLIAFFWIWITTGIIMQFDNFIVNKDRIINMVLDSKVIFGFVISSQIAIDILYFLSALLAANKIITVAREFNGLTLLTLF